MRETPCHVVPSSGEEGCGVVAIKHGHNLLKIKHLEMVEPFFISTTPNPSFQKEGTSWLRLFTLYSILPCTYGTLCATCYKISPQKM